MPDGLSVLGLFPAFPPEEVGGIEESARIAWAGITSASSARGASATLFSYTANKSALSGPCDGSILASGKAHAVLAALRGRWSPDLVLIWHIGLLKLLPFFRLPAARVIQFLHGIEVWRRPDWVTRRLLPQVNLFLSNSDYTWDRFLSNHSCINEFRHLTVSLGLGRPLGVPPTAPSSPPAALMLSRLSKVEDYKGHREVIAAWPLVLRQMPDARLWIAGDGDLRPELGRLVKAGNLADSVLLFGRVTEQKKQELLQQSRCFVLPSRAEGFGLVYLEAMRLGRPCLVSTLDAGREVVNPPEAGLAVDPGDKEALAASLCRLLSDSGEWRRWASQAKSRYESAFTARHFQSRLASAVFDGVHVTTPPAS